MSDNRIHDSSLDESVLGLNDSPSKASLNPKKTKLRPIQKGELSETGQNIIGSPGKRNPKGIPKGYQIANFQTAMNYWNRRNYSRRVLDQYGEVSYQPYQVCDDLQKLKEYGLGVYLYLQFIKELLITCIIISAISSLPAYIFYGSDGLSTYPESFTLTLATMTQGNLVNGTQFEYLCVVSADVFNMIIMFCFYVRWRYHHKQVVQESQLDHKILNPSLYALTINGFDPKTPNVQKSLKGYFDAMFHGAYEVEVVYNYKRNFNKFIDLEQQIEKIQKERQIIKQTDKGNQELIQYQKQLDEMEEQIAQILHQFEPIHAIVHFRNLKAKYAFINLCKKYALVDKFGYKLRRCLCCMPGLPERQKFLSKYDLMIENNNIARPDEINWNNIDISFISRVVRMIISLILIIITMFITSSLICFCTLYVSSTASCSSYDENTTLETALNSNNQILFCFCSANIGSIFSDSAIQTACSDLTEDITVSNIVQIGASVVSAVSNVILIVVVSLVAEFLYKPDSKPKQYSFIFVFVFLSNYINSTLLPLVLNGDISGFVSVNYLTFVEFINFDTVAIFKDFDRDWFAIISPYYTNFFIIGAITPLIQLVVFFIKRRVAIFLTKRKCENSDPDHPSIQKQANNTIIMFPFDFPTDVAVLCLQLFMCFMYSGLIPLAMPIFTVGLFITYFTKRYILLNYTVRIPADQALNAKVVNLIPFIILVHGLFSMWAHTVPGFYLPQSFLTIDFPIDIYSTAGEVPARAVTDLIQCAATGLILIWIVLDWTVFVLIGFLIEMCKDQLHLPVTLASLQNQNYAQRIKNSNILGSYKIAKNPDFGHAYRAYRELTKRVEVQGKKGRDEQSSVHDF